MIQFYRDIKGIIYGGEGILEKLDSLLIDLPEDIKNLVTYGDYNGAEQLIELYFQRNIPTVLRERLIYEKHRMQRLKGDYLYSAEEALEMAGERIRDFTAGELEELRRERYADWAFIEGEVRFHKLFLENIIRIYPGMKERLLEEKRQEEKQEAAGKKQEEKKEAAGKKQEVKQEGGGEKDLLERTIEEIIKEGEKGYYIRLRAGIKLKKEAARPGEIVRVHLPVPVRARQISNIKLLDSSHEPAFISPEEYPQRTVFFEEKVRGEDLFTVEYSYENRVSYQCPAPERATTVQPSFYTGEWPPHIVFTPLLKALAAEIVGGETNPLEKARLIYDYITRNVQYSFVREYAGFINISEYAACNLKGDCGVQALFFITLCRITGIPARWQSGLFVHPEAVSCHDWAEFYIEPFGWLFADLSFGGSGYRRGNERKHQFYFGNLDPFRMAANTAFQYPLLPEKDFFRYDPYTNQIGEAEYPDRGIYAAGFDSIREIVEMREI